MRIRRLKTHFDLSRFKYPFLFSEEDPATGRVWFGQVVTMSELEPGAFAAPTFELGESEAQELLDSLWRAGLRPKDARAGSEVIQAMKDHIEDLRASHAVALRRAGGE